MSHIFLLLKRDWYASRKYFLSYLVLWIMTPISIHTFFSIPLSYFIELEISFLNWSAAGVWFVSSGLFAFLESAGKMQSLLRNNQISSFLKTPISNSSMLLSIIFRGVIFGFIQFITAYIITCAFNNEYFSLFSFFMITIQIFVVILFFSIFGLLFGIIIKKQILFIEFSFLLFVMMSLGMGGFIPLNNYPDSFAMFMNKIPIVHLLSNIQAILIHQDIFWIGYFLTLFISVIMFIMILIISNKIFRKI